jgi:hypothetical protein
MLRLMTAALIAIGVIAFLAIDAYILYRVFASRASADDYGRFMVPGETTVTVPAGSSRSPTRRSTRPVGTGTRSISACLGSSRSR